MKFRATNIDRPFSLFIYNIKNIIVTLILLAPLTIAVLFSLTNFMHLVGIICMFLSILTGFTLRIGSDSLISISSNNITIKTKHNLITIKTSDINEIRAFMSSGLNPPIILELNLINGDYKKYLIDKFYFQKTARINKELEEIKALVLKTK